MKYVIITPAYNEENYIGKTIQSVIKQSVLPSEWIIVDDGSTDRTAQIVAEQTKDIDWIRLEKKQKSAAPFGANVVETFHHGFEKLLVKNWNFVVKLDADLDIKRVDHFEYQIRKMSQHPKLGITSGITYYTKEDGTEKLVWHPPWRTTGAMKFYRRECWRQIGGIVPVFGWDGIDEYRAMFYGWKTKTFYELRVHHLANYVSYARRNAEYFLNKGKSLYVRGFPFYFLFLKSIHWTLKGNTLAARKLLKGYSNARQNNVQRVVSNEEMRFIRNFQLKRALRIR